MQLRLTPEGKAFASKRRERSDRALAGLSWGGLDADATGSHAALGGADSADDTRGPRPAGK